MSTSATHSGTTPAVGGSGRGLGVAAAVLAVVIAAGFIFAVNKGNDATVSDVDARINERAFQAESDRLSGLADSVRQGLPGYPIRENPEDYPTELKRLLATIEEANQSAQTGSVEQRFAHELVEEQRSPSDTGSNPLEGIAR